MRKHIRLVGLVSLLGFAAVCILAVAQEPTGQTLPKVKPPTEQQLEELGYWLLHLSNINVLNGLNLTREQVVSLREMAVEMAALGDGMPSSDFTGAPELAEVRDGFKELSELLLKNEPVSDELRNKILRLRTIESAAIRGGLVIPPRKSYEYAQCGRCHITPGETPGGSSDTPGTGEIEFYSIAAKGETDMAHLLVSFDGKALRKVAMLGKKVDAILTETQKAIFPSFSCCLIPPRGMSDPVLVGQASTGDWEMDMLRKVRSTPEKQYPAVRRSIISLLTHYAIVKYPAVTEKDKEEMAERIGGVLDKARTMAESDFELAKAELAAGIHGKKNEELSTEKRIFKQAYFLLQPGSVKVYDELIRRIDNPTQVERPDKAPGETEKPT